MTTSLVARVGSLLGLLRLGLIVALWLRWITAATRGSSILRLASPWILGLLARLGRLGTSWTLCSHLSLNRLGFLHLANAAVVLGPLCRIVRTTSSSSPCTWLGCRCRSCSRRTRLSSRRSRRVGIASLLLLDHLGLPGHAQAAVVFCPLCRVVATTTTSRSS